MKQQEMDKSNSSRDHKNIYQFQRRGEVANNNTPSSSVDYR
jgi:hypothetical protein